MLEKSFKQIYLLENNLKLSLYRGRKIYRKTCEIIDHFAILIIHEW